jgi:hypothetical protein
MDDADRHCAGNGLPFARLWTGMGRYLSWAGRRIVCATAVEPPRPDYGTFIGGALFWVVGAVVVTAVACGLQLTLLGLATSVMP